MILLDKINKSCLEIVYKNGKLVFPSVAINHNIEHAKQCDH